MKLFYKKDYKRVLVEKENFKELYVKYLREKNILTNKNMQLKEIIHTDLITIDNYIEETRHLKNEIFELKERVKKETGAKGGMTKQINKLTKENETLKNKIEDLKKKLEESMTDKYLVKKIPAGRKPKQTTVIRSNAKQSKIIKDLKSDIDE
jgi:chromosome segregation ATPase